MSIGSPKLARREQAIEAARRRLRRLEIETHRIKAELARLEADYEDDVADWLSRKVRRRTPPGCEPAPTADRADGPTVIRLDPASEAARHSAPGIKPTRRRSSRSARRAAPKRRQLGRPLRLRHKSLPPIARV